MASKPRPWFRALLVMCCGVVAGALYFVGCGGGPQDSKPPDSGEHKKKPPDVPEGPDYFEDVTAKTGIDFTYHNGEEAGHYSILESLGGGVGLIDFDGDGLLDIFLPGGGYFDGPETIKGHPCKLYRNLGKLQFKDVTKEAGLDQPWFYTHGCAVADYDRDGWPDLLVTGYGKVKLFRNVENGKSRRFVDVTKEVIGDIGHYWGTSAAWADFDGDGFPDLYVCQYVNWSFANNPECQGYSSNVKQDVCSPRKFSSVPHKLFHNQPGKGKTRQLVDVSKEAGLRMPPREDKEYGKGLGVVVVDVNNDGKPDIYVANDTVDNFLYINESVPGKLRFKESGVTLFVARDGFANANGSMGVDAADYDGRGVASLWVTNYETENHGLYKNTLLENKLFGYATNFSGIAAIGQGYVGWGTSFLDLDRDGWEDIVVVNGHVIRHPVNNALKQRPVLFANQGNGRFEAITPRGGPYFRTDHIGRGLAVGDLDNDGWPDLVVSHVNHPVAVLRHALDNKKYWLGVELLAKDKACPVGAVVVAEVGGRKLTRFVKGGGSYATANDTRILFGLGDHAKIDRLTVRWPNGEPRMQTWVDLPLGRYVVLEQGKEKLSQTEHLSDP